MVAILLRNISDLKIVLAIIHLLYDHIVIIQMSMSRFPLSTLPTTCLFLGVALWGVRFSMTILDMIVLPRLVRFTVSFPYGYLFHTKMGRLNAAPSLSVETG